MYSLVLIHLLHDIQIKISESIVRIVKNVKHKHIVIIYMYSRMFLSLYNGLTTNKGNSRKHQPGMHTGILPKLPPIFIMTLNQLIVLIKCNIDSRRQYHICFI